MSCTEINNALQLLIYILSFSAQKVNANEIKTYALKDEGYTEGRFLFYVADTS